MRPLISTLALLAAGLAPLSPTAAATADPPTCQGRTATIVGNGHDPVMGTDGPDVIVSNGSSVYAGDGSDLVCMTHVRGRDTVVYDDTNDLSRPLGEGDGDDVIRVVSSSPRAVLTVSLSGGDDRFVGGHERDLVPRLILGVPTTSGGDDVVRTHGGDDSVDVGDGYPPENGTNGPGTDRVDLGAGDDSLVTLVPSLAHARSWTGGRGDDRLSVIVNGRPAFLDLSRHRVAFAGSSFTGFSGFDSYSVFASRVTVRGSRHADRLTVYGSEWTHAHLSSGDDTLQVDPPDAGPITAYGQRGDDVLSGSGGQDLLVGGPGVDSADGHRRVDRCRAEHTSRCELR